MLVFSWKGALLSMTELVYELAQPGNIEQFEVNVWTAAWLKQCCCWEPVSEIWECLRVIEIQGPTTGQNAADSDPACFPRFQQRLFACFRCLKLAVVEFECWSRSLPRYHSDLHSKAFLVFIVSLSMPQPGLYRQILLRLYHLCPAAGLPVTASCLVLGVAAQQRGII